MSETTTTTTTTEYHLGHRYSDGDHGIFFVADDLEIVIEERAKLIAAKPWLARKHELILLKVTTTTTTQEIE